MADVRTRIAMARQRFGKMRHLWSDKVLHQNLRIRLYRSCVCSIMTYGSEAWKHHSGGHEGAERCERGDDEHHHG